MPLWARRCKIFFDISDLASMIDSSMLIINKEIKTTFDKQVGIILRIDVIESYYV